MLNFEVYFEVFYSFWLHEISELQMSIIASHYLVRCFTYFDCMKDSELQISTIICFWLPLLAPSHHINREIEVGFLLLVVIISDER